MRTYLLCLVTILAPFLCAATYAQEPFSPSWIGQVSGNPDVFKVALLRQPAPRVQVGVELGYWDFLDATVDDVTGVPVGPAFTTEVVARYFALEKQPVDLMLFQVDASAYVGIGLGAEWVQHERVDDIADLRTGVLFGDGPVSLGIEYSYVMSDLMWSGTANADHRVMGTIAYRFGR